MVNLPIGSWKVIFSFVGDGDGRQDHKDRSRPERQKLFDLMQESSRHVRSVTELVDKLDGY